MVEDDTIQPREGYRVFLEPIIGLTQLLMTNLTVWVVLEALSTEHGRAFVQQLPALIKTMLRAHL